MRTLIPRLSVRQCGVRKPLYHTKEQERNLDIFFFVEQEKEDHQRSVINLIVLSISDSSPLSPSGEHHA